MDIDLLVHFLLLHHRTDRPRLQVIVQNDIRVIGIERLELQYRFVFSMILPTMRYCFLSDSSMS